MTRYTSLSTSIVLAALLSACAVGPDYKEPSFGFPNWWHSDEQKTENAAPKAAAITWWQDFHDDTLNDLVARALKNNNDLQIANARILEARAINQSTTSGLFPELSANGNAQNTKEVLFGNESLRLKNYSTTFNASWEPDFFGGTRRAVEAGKATIEAREADLDAARIALIGDVARNYVEWRQQQQQIALTRQTANAQKSLLDIAEQKYEAGTGSYLEASQAKTLYKQTMSSLPEQERQREVSGYRLSVLLGETPGALNNELQKMQNLPKPLSVPALSAPSDTIRHRPDVRVAERELASATAMQGVAFSELFPKISLTGFFGMNGASLSDSTRTWSMSSAVSIPLLNFGRIQGDIKAADARESQAFYTYRKTVLNAIGDVESSLTSVSKAHERVKALQETVNSANETVSIARDRYKNGLSNFTEVLDSEQQLYSAKTSLVQAQADLLNYLIALHKSLGMGV